MASKKNLNDNYLLVCRESFEASRLTGSPFWRLTFMQVTDDYTCELFHCDVDESMDNFTRSGWREIVTKPNPLAVYGGLRLSKRTSSDGLPVITADSRPKVVIDNITFDDYQALVDLIHQKHKKRHQTAFQRLFQATA